MAHRLMARIGTAVVMAACLPSTTTAQDYGTGYVPLSPEEYARQPAAVRARSAVLLSKVDLTPWFPIPRDQSFQGSCTGWAVSYAARTYYLGTERGHKPTSDADIASPAFVFNAATSKPDTRGVFCPGASLVAALNVVVEKGSVSLAQFPYTPVTCMPTPGPEHVPLASPWKMPGYEAIPAANVRKPDAYREMLERGKPVIIGVRFNHSEWQAIHGDKVWTLGANSTGAAVNSGHAMVVVGYDDDKVAANGDRGAFRLMNSWGQGWGDRGYLWISYTALTTLVQEAYVFKGALPPMIPRDGVLAPAGVAPAKVIASVAVPAPGSVFGAVVPPKPAAPPTAVPSLAPQPTAPQPAPLADLTPQLTALAQGFKTGEIKVTRADGGWRLTGYGCTDEVQYLRARLAPHADRVSLRVEETPWPACEIRGILKDAVNRGGVAARVVNLAPDAPPAARGVDITEEDAAIATTAVLRNGDRFAIEAEVQDQAPYVQIFYLQADQSAKEIWRGEIKPDGDGRRRLSLGGPNSKIKLTASRPYGTEAVLILAGRAVMTPQTMEKNLSETGFMDRLRSDLGKVVRADPGIRAQIVQVEVRESPTASQAWLITPDELAGFGSGEADGYPPQGALGDLFGPKITLSDTAVADGKLNLRAVFRPSLSARVRPETVRVEYRTAVGWRDVTDRVRARANVTAGGVSSAALGLPVGTHRLRISVLDDKGRIGISEIKLKTGA